MFACQTFAVGVSISGITSNTKDAALPEVAAGLPVVLINCFHYGDLVKSKGKLV